jgi:3-hydroxyisobutyrate dehydrogenase-like beta-hydroxyacid dehydrogenase
VLDAPVSGMRMAAEAGALTFFVGGPDSVLPFVRHGLGAMGEAVIHVGDVGAGQVVKIANNLIAFATAGVVDEAVTVARAAGVDERRLLQGLAHGSARSWIVDNWPFIRREWIASQPGGAAAVRTIVQKDLELAVAAADALAVDAPMAALAAGRVPALLADGR